MTVGDAQGGKKKKSDEKKRKGVLTTALYGKEMWKGRWNLGKKQ